MYGKSMYFSFKLLVSLGFLIFECLKVLLANIVKEQSKDPFISWENQQNLKSKRVSYLLFTGQFSWLAERSFQTKIYNKIDYTMVNSVPEEGIGLLKTEVYLGKTSSVEVEIFMFRTFVEPLQLALGTSRFGNLQYSRALRKTSEKSGFPFLVLFLQRFFDIFWGFFDNMLYVVFQRKYQ